MNLDELKAHEKATIDVDVDKLKKDERGDEVRPKRPIFAMLLIAIGILGLAAQSGIVSQDIWHYWWLLFLVKPFIWGSSFGCQKRSSHSI